jgi:hypothetical protein
MQPDMDGKHKNALCLVVYIEEKGNYQIAMGVLQVV